MAMLNNQRVIDTNKNPKMVAFSIAVLDYWRLCEISYTTGDEPAWW